MLSRIGTSKYNNGEAGTQRSHRSGCVGEGAGHGNGGLIPQSEEYDMTKDYRSMFCTISAPAV